MPVIMYFVFVLMATFVFGVELSNSINRPVVRQNFEASGWTTRYPSGSEMRCFCNLPRCISTGYMCKSSSGGCFSDLIHQSSPRSVYRGLHGCLELLTDKDKRDWCQSNSHTNLGHKKKNHPRSLLLCCYRDMCNHADSPENTKVLMNDTDNLFNGSDHTTIGNSASQIDSLGYNSSEVWFKAATIAVPICGAVILLVLIALAIRILRSESHNNSRHKLGGTYIAPQNKNNCEKFHEHLQHSAPSFHRKEHLMPTLQNPVYVNHIEELRQIRTPLIVQNEFGSQHSDKNTNVMLKYVPNCDYHHSLYDMKTYCSLDIDKHNSSFEYGSNPEVHRKNINCNSNEVNKLDTHIKTYDKNKLKESQILQ